MIYDVTLNIAYDYPAAVKDARHVLRVRPRELDGQSVRAARVTVAPHPDEAGRELDFFGNALDQLLILPEHEALSVEMRARVELRRALPDLEATPTIADLAAAAAAARETGPTGPMHFLGDSRIARRTDAVSAYARELIDPAAPAGEAVLAFASRIKADFSFAPGATTVDTPLEEAFAKREGVCQDFAHVMIAALRGVGVPAAYVSGFLRTLPPPGRPRLEGADAMHAWVDVWLGPDMGWQGFDPTNGVTVLDDHVVVAIGRDYSDVAPIDGVVLTAGPQKTSHSVDVVPVGERVRKA